MSDRRLEVGILAVFIAVILVGWGLYSVDYNHIDFDVTEEPDGIRVDLHGFLSNDYDYLFMSGGDVPDVLYYYLDESLPADATDYKQKEIQRVLDALLEIRGLSPGVRCDAAQLSELMEQQISDGQASGKGLLFCSGVLPYTLFQGGSNLLDDWLNAGGTVYWMGSEMGTRISYPEGISEDLPHIFFPEGALGDGTERYAYNQSAWSSYLGMTISDCEYGINVNAVPGALSLGLIDDDGFSSLAECAYGAGRIYVVGYDLDSCSDTLEAMNIADAISSGVDNDTVLVEHGSGLKGYNEWTVMIDVEVHPGDVLRFTFGAPYVSGGFVKTF